jgi:hypothetical protein
MYGLSVRPFWPLALMEFADRFPEQSHALLSAAQHGLAYPRTCRMHHLSNAFPFSPAVRSIAAQASSGNDAVALLVHHHGPGDPGHLFAKATATILGGFFAKRMTTASWHRDAVEAGGVHIINPDQLRRSCYPWRPAKP